MTYGSYPPPFPQRVPPPQRGKNIALLIAVAGGLVVALIIGVVVLLNHKRPAPVIETNEEKYRDTSNAFSGTVADSPAEKAAIQKTFDALIAAIKASDANAAANCFDGDRMLEEVEAKGTMPAVKNRSAVVRGMMSGFSGSLVANPNMRFSKMELRKIKTQNDHSEAVVYTRGTVDGTSVKFRWWVKKNYSGWKFYDLEDLDGGMRVSNAMSVAAAASAGGASPPWMNQVSHIQAAMQAMGATNFAAADKEITILESYTFPPDFGSTILMLRGIVHTSKGNFDEALASYDKAEAMHADLPALYYLRSLAYNATERPDKALQAAQKYIDLLGDDAKAYLEIGHAYEALKQPAQAADAYKKGIADDPTNTEISDALTKLQAKTPATTRPATTRPTKL